jgi:hypothetical protein
MDFDGFSLFLQLIVGVVIFAVFRWAKRLRDAS